MYGKNLKNDELEKVSGGYRIEQRRKIKKYTDPGTKTSAHRYITTYTVYGHKNGNYISKTFENKSEALNWAEKNLDY